MLPFRILCWGGVGDTLRNISSIPHEFIYRVFGYRCPAVYKDFTGIPLFGTTPAEPYFADIVARCPSLRWVGRTEKHGGVGQLTNRALREILALLNGGQRRYYPFTIRLSDAERAALPPKSSAFTVGIQTHLAGMQTKAWGVHNWHRYCRALLASDPELRIIIFDSDERVTQLAVDQRVQTTARLNIAQSINLVATLDFLVSIDSWAKYAAVWNNIPQLLVVPDQRADYPQLTPERLLSSELQGVYGHPKVRTIGLVDQPEPKLTLPELGQLSPEHLLEQTREAIAEFRGDDSRFSSRFLRKPPQ